MTFCRVKKKFIEEPDQGSLALDPMPSNSDRSQDPPHRSKVWGIAWPHAGDYDEQGLELTRGLNEHAA